VQVVAEEFQAVLSAFEDHLLQVGEESFFFPGFHPSDFHSDFHLHVIFFVDVFIFTFVLLCLISRIHRFCSLLTIRLPSNDSTSGVKIWEMRKQYNLKCTYGQHKSNAIQLVFDKVS
jgi:hypothetical protein